MGWGWCLPVNYFMGTRLPISIFILTLGLSNSQALPAVGRSWDLGMMGETHYQWSTRTL